MPKQELRMAAWERCPPPCNAGRSARSGSARRFAEPIFAPVRSDIELWGLRFCQREGQEDLPGEMRQVAAIHWRVRQQKVSHYLRRQLDGCRSVRRSNRGRRLGYPGAQLGGDGDSTQVVAAGEFGVSEDEHRGQGEGDQENQGDCCQAVIRDEFPLSGGVRLFGAVAASV